MEASLSIWIKRCEVHCFSKLTESWVQLRFLGWTVVEVVQLCEFSWRWCIGYKARCDKTIQMLSPLQGGRGEDVSYIFIYECGGKLTELHLPTQCFLKRNRWHICFISPLGLFRYGSFSALMASLNTALCVCKSANTKLQTLPKPLQQWCTVYLENWRPILPLNWEQEASKGCSVWF